MIQVTTGVSTDAPAKKHKVVRTLLVGVGGTGVKALLNAKRSFLENFGEVPPMIGLLAIDSTDIKDEITMRDGKIVSLDSDEKLKVTVQAAGNVYSAYPGNFNWIPQDNIKYLSGIVGTGAGQVRSNGRFIAQHNSDVIKSSVAGRIAKICRPLPIDCIYESDTDKSGTEPTTIHVVGSIAGGTGSGMMLDVIALIMQEMKSINIPYFIWPWLVMPDVFRLMAPGIASGNVNRNAYGFLKEMDYLLSMQPGDKPLNFVYNQNMQGFTNSEVPFAMVINNCNRVGTMFSNVKDLTDSIGRDLFLLSIGMSGFVNDVRDNVVPNEPNMQKAIGVSKRCLYPSSGSAELIYDRVAIEWVHSATYAITLCNELKKEGDDNWARQASYDWMVDNNIQEHDKDQLIDSLLNPNAFSDIEFDKTTDPASVLGFINSIGDCTKFETNKMQDIYDNKLKAVLQSAKNEINKIIDTKGVGSAITFLGSLKKWIDTCSQEMKDETKNHNLELSKEYNWDVEIQGCFRRGIFGPSIDRTAAEAFKGLVRKVVKEKREVVRKTKALAFYQSMMPHVDAMIVSANSLKNSLEKCIGICDSMINKSYLEVRNVGKFQYVLHEDDMRNISPLTSAELMTRLQNSQVNVSGWLGGSDDFVCNQMLSFIGNMPEIQKVRATDIEAKLKGMADAELTVVMDKLKEMSSPMWSINFGGYAKGHITLSNKYACGSKNMFMSDSKFASFLPKDTTGSTNVSFADIQFDDRVVFYTFEYQVPIFAVSNTLGYKVEVVNNAINDGGPRYYIDANWNRRMEEEKFDIEPTKPADVKLPIWVQSFVFDLIKYDDARSQYYVVSDTIGDALNYNHYEFGGSLLTAFANFNADNALQDVLKNDLANIKANKGTDVFNATIEKADIDQRIDKSYVKKVLNKKEQQNIEDPNTVFEPLRKHVSEEIKMLNSLKSGIK